MAVLRCEEFYRVVGSHIVRDYKCPRHPGSGLRVGWCATEHKAMHVFTCPTDEEAVEVAQGAPESFAEAARRAERAWRGKDRQ